MKLNFKIIAERIGMHMSRNLLRSKREDTLFYAKGRENLGDSMVPWLIEKITHKRYPYSNPLGRRGNHLFSIGSILQYATSDCYIWGSGFIEKNSKTKGRPNNITALRGPLTRNRLIELGIEVPKIYGDPALLTSRFINSKKNPQAGKIGLIPHYADWEKFSKLEIKLSNRFKFIDIRTNNIEAFVDEIASCEVVVSTSLHGLIISESFGIPVVWCEASDQVVGNGFKFYDYFSGTGRNVAATSVEDLISGKFTKYLIPKINELHQLQDDLISVFPKNYL